ncbi:tRNA preQ1(34) S-adenosylmethionine ribosyltransferase-isomerase QueA [candidate division WOR-3 bacterium]|nr:tRNA preQ1(34) S-adenosylmethionine ribosyltransferase-isomerase QueA [candidate division WOR-3 bacterium]
MKLSDFHYELPKDLIAQFPLEDRAAARLMVIDREKETISHHVFTQVADFFHEGDVLVLNDTRVFKARLQGKKCTGGKIEILLIRETAPGMWEAMISHAKRMKEGTEISLGDDMYATVEQKIAGSKVNLQFNVNISDVIREHGSVPLPHYIKREPVASDEENYQTVFAKKSGSIAAPTAGLHFTEEFLNGLTRQGITIAQVTLHIGPGTFKPIRNENIEEHIMDAEYFEISTQAASAMDNAKRIIAVGTSVCRALETYANTGERTGWADLFIYPGYRFKLVSALITNFHLPSSTPLLLVCAFAGKKTILAAYDQAIEQEYRFLSYGDAMMIL